MQGIRHSLKENDYPGLRLLDFGVQIKEHSRMFKKDHGKRKKEENEIERTM